MALGWFTGRGTLPELGEEAGNIALFFFLPFFSLGT
jgi:hypothetical protein